MDNLQVCFVTTTQYQFMIADIYARYISDKYGTKPIIFNRTFPSFNTDRFETDGKYQMVPYSIHNKSILGKCWFALRCGYLYRFSKWSRILDPQKKTILFVFNDISKLANRLMSDVKFFSPENQVFIVEEGNSTYSDTIELKNEKLWELKHTLSKIIFGYGRTSKVIGESYLIDGAIVKDVERYKELRKARNQDVRQQNKEILDYAVDFFEHYNIATDTGIESDIIYLGQPFYRNGKFFKPENDCIDAIFSIIPKEYKILLKPHPRDLVSKYNRLVQKHENVSLINEDLAAIPIEALLGLTKAKVVITIQSSAAITLADLHPEICSIVCKNTSQAKTLLEVLRAIGSEEPVFEDSIFVGKNNNIALPNTIEECKEIIIENLKVPFAESKHTLKERKFSEIDTIINEMKDKAEC